jgi:hypothetical protein
MSDYLRTKGNDLNNLCNTIRELVREDKFGECEEIISDAMGRFPHSPEPHNLIGILLETEGDHLAALKHFRAASALDPTYLPAKHNLERYGRFFYSGDDIAFDESDCPKDLGIDNDLKIEYDEHGIGRVVKRA